MSAATGIMALIKRLAARHMGKSIARKKRDGGGESKDKNRKEGKELNEDLTNGNECLNIIDKNINKETHGQSC